MKTIGNREVFAKNLSKYLARSGRSQREMAEIVGVSPSTFNDWVNGRKYPRIDKIEFMANYFGILKSDLIEDKKDSPNDLPINEGEKMLLNLFRKIPESDQEMVLQMIRVALGSRE
ncbi:MAG: helix-turn-helix transcriptional regulator [Bacteroidales bacterium]|nr:helix-turn-helix transcriptional regulator [Bacteroidales bacterium]